MPYLKLFIFFFICIIQFLNVKGEIDYTFFDIDVNLNSEYIIDEESFITDNNRGIFSNFTIVKRYPQDTKVTFDTLGASLGNYVIKTGLFVETGFCTIFEPHYQFLGKQVEQLGFSKDDCPPSPGIYGTDNFEPELSYLPDYFMPNNYVVIIKLSTPTDFISEFKLYLKVN